MSPRALLFALLVAASPLQAGEPKPFDAASPAAIASAHRDRPYIVVFWSLYCEPCREEMHQWGELQRRHPKVPIHLVSTDGRQELAMVRKYLGAQKLGKVQTWIFDDEFTERVRFAVDPAWRGELPRTYLYDRAHRAVARSGKLPAREISDWIARHAAGAQSRAPPARA
jgi:thiol-disulfide isomerase/thioredoxin